MLITSLIFIETYWNWGLKCLYWLKESNWRRIFAVPLKPVLTTTQNDENLDIFDSDSLHNLPKWKYYTQKYVLWWDECIYTDEMNVSVQKL